MCTTTCCIGRCLHRTCVLLPFCVGRVCTTTFLYRICVYKYLSLFDLFVQILSVSNMYVQYIGHVCTTTFLYWTRLQQPFCIGPFCWTCVYNNLSVMGVCTTTFLYRTCVCDSFCIGGACTTTFLFWTCVYSFCIGGACTTIFL